MRIAGEKDEKIRNIHIHLVVKWIPKLVSLLRGERREKKKGDEEEENK